MLPAMFNLTGKVALITGGSKGLGKAMARGLAEAGADIVIASRHEDELKAALSEILKGTDRKGAYLVADMSKRPSKRKSSQPLWRSRKCGKVDILINNAPGLNVPQAVDETHRTPNGTASWKSISIR